MKSWGAGLVNGHKLCLSFFDLYAGTARLTGFTGNRRCQHEKLGVRSGKRTQALHCFFDSYAGTARLTGFTGNRKRQ